MKKRLAAMFSAAVILSSCGTAAQYASSGQKYPDGIYYRPEKIITQTVSDEEVAQLAGRTEEARLFLFGDKKDTLVIPEDKSAIIRFNDGVGTSVTITADPFTEIYYDTWPWTYWRPVTFASAWWDPWYYGRYWGYYDPWYPGAWYRDPWYWGYSSIWWDPWFGNPYFWGAPHLPYHPHWHHHHHHGPDFVGDRGPDRYFGHRTSSGSSVRNTYASRNGQAGTLSGTSSVRRGAATAAGSTRTAAVRSRQAQTRDISTRGNSSGITAVRRSYGTSGISGATGTAAGTAGQSSVASSYRRNSPAGTSGNFSTSASAGTSSSAAIRNGVMVVPETARSSPANYRRPASSTRPVSSGASAGSSVRGSSTRSTVPAYGRGSSSSFSRGSSASFNRGSSSVSGSSSSFSRSSSSFSRSSSSFSRSSSGHSGGSSRSGGSHRR